MIVDLSENHRRSISITLELVDKSLCEWSDWANGRVRSGEMYREQDTFSSSQRIELQNKIASIRKQIARVRDDLQLQPKTTQTSQPIVGQASILWETLLSLESRSLGGYGQVPPELARYLDPITETLANEMNAIARLFSEPTRQ